MSRTLSVTVAVCPSGPVASRWGRSARSTIQVAGSPSSACTSAGLGMWVPWSWFQDQGGDGPVVDDEEPATWAQGLSGGAQDRGPGQGEGRVEVLRRDEVEGAVREGVRQVVPLGGHEVAEAGLLGEPEDLRDGRWGDVHRRDPPSAAGQPHRVPARAASEVECGAGGQIRRHLGEAWIDPRAPECGVLAAVPVEVLPEVLGVLAEIVGHGVLPTGLKMSLIAE